MKKNKAKFLLIKGTIFPFDVLFAVSSHKEVCNWVEKRKNYHLSDEEKEALEICGNGKAVRLSGGQIIIRLPYAKTKIGIDLADLMHEITHATFFLMEKIGVEHTMESDEIFAYHNAYLTRKILEFLDKEDNNVPI